MLEKSEPNTVQGTQEQPAIVRTTHPVRRVQAFRPIPALRSNQLDAISPQVVASRGLAQTFGLDIKAATLAVIVDLMVFGGEVLTFETLLPLGLCVAGVLALIVYKIQRKWHQDDHDSALIKALIIGLLTAIPVPLTPIIAIPGGILGIVSAVRRR
jgi:uncharacterized membrane protein YvlD (DUF360 family)